MGLEIADKTKLLQSERKEIGKQEEVYINEDKVEEIESFKYLGGQVSATCGA